MCALGLGLGLGLGTIDTIEVSGFPSRIESPALPEPAVWCC
jgi:hypothetical protein